MPLSSVCVSPIQIFASARCVQSQSVCTGSICLGHVLDISLASGYTDIIKHVKVGEFLSDHAMVKCNISLPLPTESSQRRFKKVSHIS